MTIQELAKRAGVTTRTIRYYTEQGLLPAPERGRPARYTEEHLQRLELVRRLKEQYLPLEEIRDTLQRLTVPEVEGLLQEHAPNRLGETPASSATEYIAGVLGRGAVREQLKQQAAPSYPPAPPVPPGYMAPPNSVPSPAAAPESPSVWPPATVQAPGYAPPPAAMPPVMAPRAAPAAARSMPSQADSFSEQEAAPLDGDEHAATTWHRVTLAPGMELHYLASGQARLHRLAARVAAAVKHILEESPDHPTEEL